MKERTYGLKINLQRFAENPDDDELLNDEDLELDEELDEDLIEGDDLDNDDSQESDSENDGNEDNSDDGEDETESKPEKKPEKKKPSKQEYTIIKLKKQIKEMEKAQADKDAKEQHERHKKELSTKYYNELINNGVEDSAARAKADENAEKDLKVSSLENEVKTIKYSLQAERLRAKYPDIDDNLTTLINLCEKGGLTLEEACKAKLRESSAYETKVRTEAEQAAKRIKAKAANPGSTSTKNDKQNVKLSKTDEEAYQAMIKTSAYRGLTRKQYLEM
jgi:hypothetical protein